MKSFKLLIVVFLLVGCGSNKIVYDYDNKTNFNEFKTFNFYDDAGNGMNELDVKRAQGIIENELVSKGFKKDKSPDFLINFTSQKMDMGETNSVGVGIGGGRNVGFGISAGIPIGAKKINEEFTIEFVDAKTDALFWQGVSIKKIKEKIKPQERVIYLKEVVRKTFEKYPPSKK